jgi:hypothetical protein
MLCACGVVILNMFCNLGPTSNETNLFQVMALSTKSLMSSGGEGDVGALFGNNKVLFTLLLMKHLLLTSQKLRCGLQSTKQRPS